MPAGPESIPLHSFPQQFLTSSVEDGPIRSKEEERIYKGWGQMESYLDPEYWVREKQRPMETSFLKH